MSRNQRTDIAQVQAVKGGKNLCKRNFFSWEWRWDQDLKQDNLIDMRRAGWGGRLPKTFRQTIPQYRNRISERSISLFPHRSSNSSQFLIPTPIHMITWLNNWCIVSARENRRATIDWIKLVRVIRNSKLIGYDSKTNRHPASPPPLAHTHTQTHRG